MKMQQKKNLELHNKDIFPEPVLAIRESKNDDGYKIMVVNTSLKDYEYKNLFSWSLWINIDIQNKIEFGLPTKNENEILNEIEEKLKSILKNNSLFHFIGRITHNGNRDIYFYLDNPILVHKELEDLTYSDSLPREFEYVIEEDRDWSFSEIFYNY